MPTKRFKSVDEAKQFYQRMYGRHSFDLRKFVKYCHLSGILVCPVCKGFKTTPMQIVSTEGVAFKDCPIKYTCSTCNAVFLKVTI